jgi:hypothetical protein
MAALEVQARTAEAPDAHSAIAPTMSASHVVKHSSRVWPAEQFADAMFWHDVWQV